MRRNRQPRFWCGLACLSLCILANHGLVWGEGAGELAGEAEGVSVEPALDAGSGAVSSGPAWAPHGSFFSRWEPRRGYDLGPAEGSDYVRYRARLGVDGSDLVRQGALSAGVRWSAQAGGLYGIGGDTLDHPEVGAYEATLELRHGTQRLQVGRFEMSYGEEVIIGAVGWHHLGRSFDGLRWQWRPAQGPQVDIFATTLHEGATLGVLGTPLGAGDHYFTGLYVGLAPMLPAQLELDLYTLQRIRPATDRPALGGEEAPEQLELAIEVTLGARFKGTFGMVDARAEGGVQRGHRRAAELRRDVAAWHGVAEVGVQPTSAWPRLALQAAYATGDDPDTADDEAWQTPFSTAHRWLGWTDIVGPRSNIQALSGHVSYRPLAALLLSTDVHHFTRPVGPEGSSAAFGTEVNVGAGYTLARGLIVRAAYGAFVPSSESFADDDDLRHFGELELRLTF